MENYLFNRKNALSNILLPMINTDISIYAYFKSIDKERKTRISKAKTEYYEISYDNIISQFVKLSAKESCCALCIYWHEKKDKQHLDDLNRLPVVVQALPNEGTEKVVALVNKCRCGYCTKQTNSKNIAEKAAIDICTDFIDFRKEIEICNCSHINIHSPKERFVNYVRTIRFLFELDKIYYNGIIREINYIIKNPDCNVTDKDILKKSAQKLRKHISTSSTVHRISELTGVSSDLIRNQMFRRKKKRFCPELIFALAEYFDVPPEKLLRYNYGSPLNYKVFEELDLIKEIDLDNATKVYPNTKIPRTQKIHVIPEEYFVYIVSVLLNLCTKEEIEKAMTFYEQKSPKKRSISKSRNDAAPAVCERERINCLRGTNSIVDIAAASGHSQKSMEHIMNGKSNLTGNRLYDISSVLSIEPDLFSGDQTKLEPRSGMNPFIHLNNQEHAERRFRRIRETHIASVLNQMYGLYPDITKRIMNLYMAYGIDRIRAEYIEKERDLINYLTEKYHDTFVAICGEELFDPAYF